MLRIVLAYGTMIAAFALLLAWLDWRHVTQLWSTEIYVLAIALVFAVVGIWLGNRLTAQPRPASFVRNEAAIASLGISSRECEVLELLARGSAYKVIARQLGISPNTVKTHLARLFEKLEATNRTEAIARARSLRLLP